MREEHMKNNWRLWSGAGVIAGLMLCWSGVAAAQSGASGGAAAGAAANSALNKNIGKDKSPTSVENSLDLIKPADQQEETAYKAFQSVSPENMMKKIELGEAFLQKYQVSRYRAPVYSALTSAYLVTNQVPKMEDAGEKALALNPKDVQVLAMLGQTLPRVMTSSTPDQAGRLQKAEEYSERAIEATPGLAKPEGLTDEQFSQAKNQTLAIAHSGLGLVNFRRGNYTGAIAELEQSVKLDPKADPVNYYVLGVAHQNASHFEEAAAAFSKCAELRGGMQATCKDNAEKAKKLAAPQASTPK
jgi:tetratricopeptide (TPR) repeat protein